MNDKAAVLDRGIGAKVEGAELVVEGELVGVRGDLAILAAQIADLAGLGSVLVADGILATNIGVKVSLSGSAVAVARDGGLVNVERWVTVSTCRQSRSIIDLRKGPPSLGKLENLTV